MTATSADGETLGTRYGATQADAKEKQAELIQQFDIKKGQVKIEEHEVSMAKADLLAFINELAIKADATLTDD